MGKAKRDRAKGRRETGAFVPIPVNVLTHENYYSLSTKAVKLLFDMCAQLRFKPGGPINNGDISLAWKIMAEKKWSSKDTLRKAELELLYFEFLILTRQGGRNRCNLYAVAWWAINECQGKQLEVAETNVPSLGWKEVRPPFKPCLKSKVVPRESYQCTPRTVPVGQIHVSR